jgi:hypothetical protein
MTVVNVNNDLKSNVELDELGLQKRRYEIEPAVESKAGQRLAIGLVLANSFLLLKNVLFGDSPAQSAPLPGGVAGNSAAGGQEIHEGVANDPGQGAQAGDGSEGEDDNEDEAGEGRLGAGVSFGLNFDPYA